MKKFPGKVFMHIKGKERQGVPIFIEKIPASKRKWLFIFTLRTRTEGQISSTIVISWD
jgi:hypothetical protein